MLFVDRRDAGRRLAARLDHLRARSDVVVVGLPRGGVPVAYEVARTLGAPLDVIVVRKLGVPFQPELAMGAIGEGGVRVLNDDIVSATRVTAADITGVEQHERAELERRVRRFRGGRQAVPLAGTTVVLVDDGVATGSTARAACQVVRAKGAARVVLAVPVAPRGWVARFSGAADELVALETPEVFYAVGEFYGDFSQTTDDEVIELLEQGAPPFDGEVTVSSGDIALPGRLTVPASAGGTVVFAHGSGSSRHSPRNQLVADTLHRARFATLLFDLLTPREELDRGNVFDIRLLAGRLLGATAWIASHDVVGRLPIGYFGASTGAAAALWAAAEPGSSVGAVVSRGGRPDLAGARLARVVAPTLLIVGGEDRVVLELNEAAKAQLRCENRLSVVPGATHLFEERGALALVADLASGWFAGHLRAGRGRVA